MATVTISQGTLRGNKSITEKGVEYYEFLGIPYAKPPVGELRFKSPQTPEPWNGIYDATVVDENKIACQTNLSNNYQIIGTEDCLYLNVYSPKLPENEDPSTLPVMFFIHGGGFVHGNGIIKEELGPDFLIDNGVVVVTINYRLGIFGFLCLDIPEASGNMGLKDQVQALRWVQNNITEFGGDINNVTIFGMSAGGASVDYLILSPLAKGLFHRAILHSGSSLNHWSINYEPRSLIKSLLQEVGYAGSINDDIGIYRYLVMMPTKLLIRKSFDVANNYTKNRVYFGFVPTIEKDFGSDVFLTDIPYKLFREGKFNRVPVIKGFCDKEGYLMNIIHPKTLLEVGTHKEFTKHWAYDLDKGDFCNYNTAFRKVYSDIDLNEASDKIGVDFFGDFDFKAGILISGDMLAELSIPVYVYQFSYNGQINFLKRIFGLKWKGAGHVDDMTYIFNHTISKEANNKDIAVRNRLTEMWTNFAKTGDPNSKKTVISVRWPMYEKNKRFYINFDEEFTVKSEYELEKIKIFRNIYDKYQK